MSGLDPTLSQPRVGCGAVILDRDGRLLLGRRLRPPEAGAWGLFGGKVDWMEPVEAAVEREILEEVGLEVRTVRLLCVADLFVREPAPGSHWVSPVYLAERIDPSAEPVLREPHAIGEIGWFALDALPAPLTQSVLTALPRIRSLSIDAAARQGAVATA